MNINALLNKMSLEEKVGQMFMLAFAGKRLDEVKTLIQSHFIGACYISQANAETPQEAIEISNQLQEYARTSGKGIPLILGVDQEGAWGVLVPYSTTGPGNLGLGATADPNCTRRIYQILGREMTAVGYNTLLCPCADVNSNPTNPIIGMRSFGEDPREVSEHVAAAVAGAHDGGAITTAKHFPGHGDTSTDSHRGLPRVERSRQALYEIDLPPFRAAVQAGVDIIMTSHILFPALDSQYPATLSPFILQELLREEMGFKGVVLSDSMNMGAIRKNYSPNESAILAVLAGVDMIMLAEEHYDHDPAAYIEKQLICVHGVLDAVRKGRIPPARIDQAVRRILELKDRYRLFERQSVPLSNAEIVGQPEHRQIESEIAEQSVTLVRDQRKLIPLPPHSQVALVNVVPHHAYAILTHTRGIGPNQSQPAFDIFENTLRQLHGEIFTFHWEQLQETLPAELTAATIVVAITEDYPLPGVDFATVPQRELVQRLSTALGERMVVVGLRTPYELVHYPRVSTYLTTCSSRPCAAIAAARAVAGKISAQGRLPVSLL